MGGVDKSRVSDQGKVHCTSNCLQQGVCMNLRVCVYVCMCVDLHASFCMQAILVGRRKEKCCFYTSVNIIPS